MASRLQPPMWPLHLQFVSHAILLCWMLAASFIDIDEKIIPDEITVTGTLLGLMLATIVPMSLLPHVAERPAPPVVGEPARERRRRTGDWAERRPLVAGAGDGGGAECLAAGVGLCRARGTSLVDRARLLLAVVLCTRAADLARAARAGVCAAADRQPSAARVSLGRRCDGCWWRARSAIVVRLAFGERPWAGLLTALVGLVGSGGIVWAVRLIGTAALRREAMGFGDVTLMMMVGTFLGWQACLIAFFLAPFAGLVIGIVQFISRRDDVIP